MDEGATGLQFDAEQIDAGTLKSLKKKDALSSLNLKSWRLL